MAHSAKVPAAEGLLPEPLRRQYLEAMGIQTWYDPTLPDCLSDPQPSPESLPEPSPAPCQQTEKIAQQTPGQHPVTDVSLKPAQTREATTSSLESLNARIEQCQLCELHIDCQQRISGQGNAQAELLVVTDAPVDAGLYTPADHEMLQTLLGTIGIAPESAYFTSLVKCKPVEQRGPQTSEVICCEDHLLTQIKLIQPSLILVLGEAAAQQLLVTQKNLCDLRLRQHQYQGVPVYVSCHPRELPGCADSKRKVWHDLLQIEKYLKQKQ